MVINLSFIQIWLKIIVKCEVDIGLHEQKKRGTYTLIDITCYFGKISKLVRIK